MNAAREDWEESTAIYGSVVKSRKPYSSSWRRIGVKFRVSYRSVPSVPCPIRRVEREMEHEYDSPSGWRIESRQAGAGEEGERERERER